MSFLLVHPSSDPYSLRQMELEFNRSVPHCLGDPIPALARPSIADFNAELPGRQFIDVADAERRGGPLTRAVVATIKRNLNAYFLPGLRIATRLQNFDPWSQDERDELDWHADTMPIILSNACRPGSSAARQRRDAWRLTVASSRPIQLLRYRNIRVRIRPEHIRDGHGDARLYSAIQPLVNTHSALPSSIVSPPVHTLLLFGIDELHRAVKFAPSAPEQRYLFSATYDPNYPG